MAPRGGSTQSTAPENMPASAGVSCNDDNVDVQHHGLMLLPNLEDGGASEGDAAWQAASAARPLRASLCPPRVLMLLFLVATTSAAVCVIPSLFARRGATRIAEGGSQQLNEAPCSLTDSMEHQDPSNNPCKPVGLLGNSEHLLESSEHKSDQLISLFCYCVTLTWGYELDLVREQYKQKAGVFGCSAWSAFSLESVPIIQGVNTTGIPGPPARWADVPHKGYKMAYNTNVFLRAWESLNQAGTFRDHDWVVKADVDAVFFPSRLQQMLSSKQWAWTSRWQASVYVKNCWNFKSMQGPLELLTRSAFNRFVGSGMNQCQSFLAFNDLGEDQFLDTCLHKLGVQSVNDFNMVDDAYCDGISDPNQMCKCDGAGPERVAFHPCKSVDKYFTCVVAMETRNLRVCRGG